MKFAFKDPTRFFVIKREAFPTTSINLSHESVVFDSYDFVNGDIFQNEREFFDRLPTQEWDGRRHSFVEKMDSPDALLAIGFYELEEWGVWSRTDNPKLVLPFLVEGEIVIEIETVGFGSNVGRDIQLKIGGAGTQITLSPHPHTSTHLLRVNKPSRIIEFNNLAPAQLAERDDPRTMAIGVSKISIAAPSLGNTVWDGSPTFIDLADPDHMHLDLFGFHSPESWGVWSERDTCHILLPFSIPGECEIQFFAQGLGQNNGSQLHVSLGDASSTFVLEQEPKQFIFRFTTSQPSQILTISGLRPDTIDDRPGARRMGIGIHRLQITLPPDGELVAARAQTRKKVKASFMQKWLQRHSPVHADELSLKVSGFTTVAIFNDCSNSNQWRDVVSAFLWTFRDQENATLIVQNSNVSMASFFSELMFLLFRVGEKKCRVVAIHTPDSHRDAQAILEVAHVYVHVDSSIPLEFAASIANRKNTRFIVSTPEKPSLEGGKVTVIKPHRRPIKTSGYLHRVERELEFALDWVRLSEEMKCSFTEWKVLCRD